MRLLTLFESDCRKKKKEKLTSRRWPIERRETSCLRIEIARSSRNNNLLGIRHSKKVAYTNIVG